MQSQNCPQIQDSIEISSTDERPKLVNGKFRLRAVGDESAPYTGPERRRFPRIEIFGQIQGQVLPLNIQITVLDIGLGGLYLQTMVRLPVGRLLELCLTLNDGESLVIPARVIRSLHATGTDGLLSYVTGLEFVADGTTHTELAMDRLLGEYAVA